MTGKHKLLRVLSVQMMSHRSFDGRNWNQWGHPSRILIRQKDLFIILASCKNYLFCFLSFLPDYTDLQAGQNISHQILEVHYCVNQSLYESEWEMVV